MIANTVAQMSQSELQEMLEAVVETTVERKQFASLGDPDECLEVREAVRDRLLLRRQAVAATQGDQPFEDAVLEHGLG